MHLIFVESETLGVSPDIILNKYKETKMCNKSCIYAWINMKQNVLTFKENTWEKYDITEIESVYRQDQLAKPEMTFIK